MKEILERLQHPNLKIQVFSEAMILNEPVEEWPICQCLIAFFSMGFPLEKALAYAKLRNPLLINDLESQYNLLDRYGIRIQRVTIWWECLPNLLFSNIVGKFGN